MPAAHEGVEIRLWLKRADNPERDRWKASVNPATRGAHGARSLAATAPGTRPTEVAHPYDLFISPSVYGASTVARLSISFALAA